MQLIKYLPDHRLKPFDCGDDDLNDFISEDAAISYSELLTVTYIIEDEEKTLAYFSVLNDKITYDEASLSNRGWKRFQSKFPQGKS